MNSCIFPMLSEESMYLPFYIKCIGGWANQEAISRPEGYPDFQFFLCINGEGILKTDKNEYLIKKGMGFILAPDIPHEYYGTKEPWELRWIAFSGSSVHQCLKIMGLDTAEVYSLTDINGLDKLHQEMFVFAQTNNSTKELECSVLLYRFLIEFMNYTGSEQGNLKLMKEKLQPAVSFMDNNYSRKLSLSDISNTIGASPQHLCRLFRQVYSLSPFNYLIKYRVLKAKELIISPEYLKIADIARMVGYTDTSYFCTIFKELEGVTPTEFRRIYRSD